jgi:nicotinate-nucleotide adenylyltransferase
VIAGKRLGIYGGTFDPVHAGHLVAAADVHHALRLDQVVFMPAGQPPHKEDLVISMRAHRWAMLELAIAGRPQFALSDLDFASDTPAYTAELLARLRAAWQPADDLYFIMGEDSLRDFPCWREPERIARLARLAVVTRPRVKVDIASVVRAVPALAGRVACVAIPALDIASHDIRARVAAGRPIAYQVPRAVEEYIYRHRLYYS